MSSSSDSEQEKKVKEKKDEPSFNSASMMQTTNAVTMFDP